MESYDFSSIEQSTISQSEGDIEQKPSGIGSAIDLSLYFLLRSTTEVIDHSETIDNLLSRIADERELLQQDVARIRSEREALLYHIRELKTATDMDTSTMREQAKAEAAAIVADGEQIRSRAVEDAKALDARIQAAEKRARAILNDLLNVKSPLPYEGDADSTHLFQSTAIQPESTNRDQATPAEPPVVAATYLNLVKDESENN